MSQCSDRVVGNILAGWRYDISGLAPEMREDYERHFAECDHCRSRQKLHRGIDIALMALATISAGVFVLSFAVIRYFKPSHAFVLELIAMAGFFLSAIVWLLVAVATPAPVVVVAVARHGARNLHDRLPENIREKLPEELRTKIIGDAS